jgi:transglutaminase-like putative cysteine protease
MFLAPDVPMGGELMPLADGVPGTMQTLALMRQLVTAYRTSDTVRRAASSIMFLTPDRGQAPRARALYEWTRAHVRYVPDILDVETLQTPDQTLRSLVGDCDDSATLLATMFEAVGYPTRFVLAAYQQTDQFEHVYLQVLIDGVWVDADPTEPHYLGWAAPDPVRLFVEKV